MKIHFQKLQDRHKLCISDITLFAYDYLFEQQRNSHEEYLANKSTSNQGADMIMVHHLGQLSQDSENLSKCQIAWDKSPPESLGALDMNSSDEWCRFKDLRTVWQHNNRGTSLHSENVNIVKKILRKIKDPLG